MLYRTLKVLLGTAVGIFFRRIEVEGVENVPDTGPVLLLPNHPNALVDALVIVMQLKRPVSLTAKSTLADNAVLKFFIKASKIILFHRKQDSELGADPSRNVKALEECQRRLNMSLEEFKKQRKRGHLSESLAVHDIEALLRFAFDWLKFALAGLPSIRPR